MRAEIHAGAAFSQVVPISDFSEDGLFARVAPVLSPGTRATIRFMHPDAGRIVTTRAVVARRQGMGECRDRQGIGFYLMESLTELGGERRSGDRSRATIPARIRVGNMEVGARIVDISDWGAALDIDLGLKSAPEGSGGPRRVVPFAHLLRAGQPLSLGFHHPATRLPVQVEAVLARNPTPVEGRCDYRLGIRFNLALTAMMGVQTRAAAPPIRTDATRITGAANLDRMATQELNMRSLLRAVDWDAEDGTYGDGRVVLAGKDRLLVATMYDPPAKGVTATVTLQTQEDSSLPPLPIQVEVAQSGANLVAGREPGFIAKIRTFYSDADAQRYESLVSWIVQGLNR